MKENVKSTINCIWEEELSEEYRMIEKIIRGNNYSCRLVELDAGKKDFF